MHPKGTKRLILGAVLAVVALVYYNTVVEPNIRQIEAMSGSFLGSMAIATSAGQQAAEQVAGQRLLAWGVGLTGCTIALWGWVGKKRSARAEVHI